MSNSHDFRDRVADAPSDNFVYRALPPWLWPYAQLARWDRPIGWQLLLWPCFWSVTLAANAALTLGEFVGPLLFYHLILYFIGAVAMRGAGCTFNDLIDHDIDASVARTRSRPLPSGRVSRKQAKIFIALQALVGLFVLLQFNWFCVGLGLLSLGLVAVYPFAKRFTDWPQFFLGLAFSWGALMGWAGIFGSLSLPPILLYIAAILWTIGYDTIYAHQDKEDDELIGVRSTARLFGEKTKVWLVGLYGAALVLMFLAFALAGAGLIAFLGLVIAGGMFAYQIVVLDIEDAPQCLILFRSNGRVGAIIFAGLLLSMALSTPG
ncbi:MULTISPECIES: 4-hydroxybenzoate octaprenyltransferase [unclassified Rhizobium]|uniref:4-hydroxybenzoate octaprenyltransferase n=1 Tax=unclassified Rhizobium TaxID=2613769 RepID=UPI001ADD20FD|nr:MULTISPECIES: 4-hydroxybenzoate octaprenyltransferase [unclassified Rhizobium]MBO9097465.1 4-hydroxybenzoate octaprenyltransferase [Rhizobium sp. L58/93]MBO9133683.1 4-hydroxybenzoate octaprenyltransferase [Rhizobium sp. B209b/85]MBO9167704.1 4-hydroxybenzoate octaprenyltransferase [Rhizobium sp. L245/93]MBO9183663.1 4-hydroxybenzoate octaprenyltransferase [Rhizobium sp. E27B/91]QXZ83981.1 4-hydroxybenzoate octaprenyltransferase [Rhizobium sp. K1/93]